MLELYKPIIVSIVDRIELRFDIGNIKINGEPVAQVVPKAGTNAIITLYIDGRSVISL